MCYQVKLLVKNCFLGLKKNKVKWQQLVLIPVYDFHIHHLSFPGFKTNHLTDQLAVHLLAYLVRAMHQCHRGHGFESLSQSLDILQVFLLQKLHIVCLFRWQSLLFSRFKPNQFKVMYLPILDKIDGKFIPPSPKIKNGKMTCFVSCLASSLF